MCFRHFFALTAQAFGCLLDLTGREYPRRARTIIRNSRGCERCSNKRIKKFGADPYASIDDPAWPWPADSRPVDRP